MNRSLLLLMACISGLVTPCFGQATSQSYLAVEVLKPRYDFENQPTLLTSAVFVSVRLPLDDRIGFKAELPFAHANLNTAGARTQNTLGNPYLGLEIGNQSEGNRRIWGEVGVRLPLAPDDDDHHGAAATIGFQSDMVKRVEAFTTELLPITGILHYRYRYPSGLDLQLQAGGSYLHAMPESIDGQESGWFLLYAAELAYELKRFTLGAEFAGRKWLTADDGQRPHIFQLSALVETRVGRLVPGLNFSVPISNELLQDRLDFVLGLSLKYSL